MENSVRKIVLAIKLLLDILKFSIIARFARGLETYLKVLPDFFFTVPEGTIRILKLVLYIIIYSKFLFTAHGWPLHWIFKKLLQ